MKLVKCGKAFSGKVELEFEQVFPFSTGEILKQLPKKKCYGIDRALKVLIRLLRSLQSQ